MTQGCVVAKLLDKFFETGDTRFCVAADIIDRIVGTVHLVLCCRRYHRPDCGDGSLGAVLL